MPLSKLGRTFTRSCFSCQAEFAICLVFHSPFEPDPMPYKMTVPREARVDTSPDSQSKKQYTMHSMALQRKCLVVYGHLTKL